MSDSAVYQFVDTNVLVYAHDISAGVKHQKAREILVDLWETDRGCLSIQVLQEFYVTVTRKVAKPLSNAQASQIIRSLRVWRVHSPSVEDIERAIEIQSRYLISYWDAMILQSATQLQCNLLWSEDLNPQQQYAGVQVINPFI